MRLLVIEDDQDLADILVMGLQNAAYATDLAPTWLEASRMLAFNPYDVVCLDLGLPDGDGLDLLKQMNEAEHMPRPRRIIITTARDAVAERVAGLDAGADDYLVKPFAFEELLARVRAVSRRSDQVDSILRAAGIELDTKTLAVSRDGRAIDLTPRELALLRHMMIHSGQVLSAEHLIEHVWDINADPFSSSFRVILSRLRKKLGEPQLIETVTSLGYRLGKAEGS